MNHMLIRKDTSMAPLNLFVAAVTARRWLTLRVALMVAVLTCATTLQNRLHGQEIGQLVSWNQLETATDDLIRLSTSYTDALRDLKIARVSVDTLQTLRPNVVVTNLELQVATLNVEAAERKVKLLRAIAEKQLMAAENKLEIVKYLEARFGEPSNDNNLNDRQFIRAQDEATVQILKMILEMQ
ncbi:MAG: hypothetical protein CMJ77_02340 [Planctomycetaceae bacterium]|nr:hypothetical protein [Planctomycetaceae bacterium]